MKTYNNFDEQIFMDIAKSTGNEQIIDDVGYGIYIKHFFPERCYFDRLEEDAFLIGYVGTKGFRIVGIATRPEVQGKGYATVLVQRAIKYCQSKGIKKIRTKTLSGKDFYQRTFRAQIVGMSGKEYLLEIDV